MKKTLISIAILSLTAPLYADDVPATPTETTVQTQEVAPAPEPQKPTDETQNTVTSEESQVSTPAVIDCHYTISAETKEIPNNILEEWASKAAVQAFDYDATNIDAKMKELSACFTEEGWKSYQDALTKSGNMDAIKKDNLNVSSQVSGAIDLKVNADNQWKMTMPLDVVYQNQKEKLTQNLIVNLIVGRKTNGDLGIMQMIATPRQATQAVAAPAKEDVTE